VRREDRPRPAVLWGAGRKEGGRERNEEWVITHISNRRMNHWMREWMRSR
jgi:hypothetical protein